VLIFFWDSQGLILDHFQEWSVTIRSAHYSEMLCDRKLVIRSKHNIKLSEGVVA
jgi:hypothetical protein